MQITENTTYFFSFFSFFNESRYKVLSILEVQHNIKD